ncbi:hypothetical protein CapIbe_021842 [Capra ibex]
MEKHKDMCQFLPCESSQHSSGTMNVRASEAGCGLVNSSDEPMHMEPLGPVFWTPCASRLHLMHRAARHGL